tara:strand:+ start:607 stop:885 length:279 start_codon:yes stop_codon:yes gene_type:complete
MSAFGEEKFENKNNKLYFEVSVFEDENCSYESYTIKYNSIDEALDKAEEIRDSVLIYNEDITCIIVNEYMNNDVFDIWSWYLSQDKLLENND